MCSSLSHFGPLAKLTGGRDNKSMKNILQEKRGYFPPHDIHVGLFFYASTVRVMLNAKFLVYPLKPS